MSNNPDHITLAIGPANYAGQAYYWAEAVRRFRHIDAFAFSYRVKPALARRSSGFQFDVHRRLPHHRMTNAFLKAFSVRRILKSTTHIAVDGFLPLFDRLDRSHAGNDIQRLTKMGLHVSLIAHGSDVRDPDAHMERYPFSYYKLGSQAWVDALRSRSAINRRTAENAGVPVFVSTPDLLLDIPTATWLPLTVDLDTWRSSRAVLEAAVPTVVHVPSRQDPPIKGTAVIDPVLRQLDDAGRIRYVSASGLPHAAMQKMIRSADIVVDQVLSGYYGAAAVEGMAAGRVVIGNVGSVVRASMPEAPPIVDAGPGDFAEVIEHIIADPGHFAELAARGPGFTQRWHDGRAAAMSLAPFLAV